MYKINIVKETTHVDAFQQKKIKTKISTKFRRSKITAKNENPKQRKKKLNSYKTW